MGDGDFKSLTIYNSQTVEAKVSEYWQRNKVFEKWKRGATAPYLRFSKVLQRQTGCPTWGT